MKNMSSFKKDIRKNRSAENIVNNQKKIRSKTLSDFGIKTIFGYFF